MHRVAHSDRTQATLHNSCTPWNLCIPRLQSPAPTILCKQLIAFIGLIGKLALSMLSERRCTMQHNAVCSQSAHSTMPIMECWPKGKEGLSAAYQVVTSNPDSNAWFYMFNMITWIKTSDLVNQNKPLVNFMCLYTVQLVCVPSHCSYSLQSLRRVLWFPMREWHSFTNVPAVGAEKSFSDERERIPF